MLLGCSGFEWDKGNIEKNWKKHRVSPVECEQVFFNQPVIISGDVQHSAGEFRYYTLGRTDTGRLLFVSFTIRGNNMRVISARNMSRKERRAFQAHEKETDSEIQK